MKNKSYFYWVIASVAFLEMATYVGFLNNINGLFIIPISTSLGITRGTYSLALSARSMMAVISNLVASSFLRRFGYRKSVAVSLGLAAVGMLVLAFSGHVSMLALGAILIGAAEGVCSGGGVSRLVSSWFHKHHGLILGLVTAASGLGGSVLAIVLTALIGIADWRVAIGVSAGLFIAVDILILLLVRDKPECVGLTPFGEGHDIKNKQRVEHDHWLGFSEREIKRKASFYLLAALTLLSSVCQYMALSVLIPYYQDLGMSSETAAEIYSILMVALSASKLLFGFVSDKTGVKPVTLFCLASLVAAMFLLTRVNGTATGYAAAIVLALALPLTGVTVPLLVPSLFGYRSGGAGIGICLSMISAASMLGGTFSNYLFGVLGSYRPIFMTNFFVSIVLLGLYILLFFWTGRDRRKLEAEQKMNSGVS